MSEAIKPEYMYALYVVIGFLVVSNFTLVIAAFKLVFKAGEFVTATKLGIEAAKEDAAGAEKTGVRAHKRIDKLEERMN